MDDDVVWAEGTHEYRPMGAAVIAATDLFRVRDFQARRPMRADRGRDFAGYFASLGELNDYLLRKRHDKQTTHPHHYGGVLSDS